MPEGEVVEQSLLSWLFTALGFQYAILLPLSGMICFLLVVIIVVRGRGPMSAAALVLVVHIPLFIGVYAAVRGAMASYIVVATTQGTARPQDVAAGISTALVAPMVGLLVMIPSYATAVLGALIRSLLGNEEAQNADK